MRILIVEDERVAARRLERLVRDFLGDRLESVRIAETLDQTTEVVGRIDIDVLLLDLNLHGEDGFEVLKTAVAESFQTIVVSANTDRAIEAFEYGVLDFVPKPVDRIRLGKALDRSVERGATQTRMLVVKTQGRLQPIPIENVHFFQGAGDYAEIHLRDGGIALHGKSLESLERILPDYYIRTHKSYILDIRDIKQLHIHGGGKYEAEIGAGLRLPVSRTRYKNLNDRLAAI